MSRSLVNVVKLYQVKDLAYFKDLIQVFLYDGNFWNDCKCGWMKAMFCHMYILLHFITFALLFC